MSERKSCFDCVFHATPVESGHNLSSVAVLWVCFRSPNTEGGGTGGGKVKCYETTGNWLHHASISPERRLDLKTIIARWLHHLVYERRGAFSHV